MNGKTKLWLGIGAFALVGAGATPDPTGGPIIGKAALAQHAAHPAAGGEGGEGGEAGGEAAFAGASPEVALTGNLLLIKGHLAVGDELVADGDWKGATPHFLHPVEEIYDEIVGQLRRRGISGFKSSLDALSKAVLTKDAARYPATRRAVMAKLDEALGKVPPGTRTSPAFVREVAVGVLEVAADEYGAAFEEGRMANIVEYQDSRGFVWTIDELIRANAETLAKAGPDALREIQAKLVELKRAWPNAQGPESPALDAAQVTALVSQIELAASTLR